MSIPKKRKKPRSASAIAREREAKNNRAIDAAFIRIAKPTLYGEGHNRNKRWRILEEERKIVRGNDEL